MEPKASVAQVVSEAPTAAPKLRGAAQVGALCHIRVISEAESCLVRAMRHRLPAWQVQRDTPEAGSAGGRQQMDRREGEVPVNNGLTCGFRWTEGDSILPF